MVTITFSGMIRKVGDSYVVTIPASYVNNKLVDEGQRYDFEIKR